jgi:hypothetical protein
MEFVRSVGKGFFPLDEELELLPGTLTPHGHECLVRLAGWMPFGKAAEMLEDFMGIRVSRSMSQRYTEMAGAVYEQMQAEEVEYLEKDMPWAPKGANKIQISADGATPHLRWVQVWCRYCMGSGQK